MSNDLSLDVRNITKRFGGLLAVSEASMQIPRQTIASLIGPNGAGKTTFFNCVTGFYKPEEGEIIFNGRPIHGLRPDQVTGLGIARTYQNIHLFGNMTVLENIIVGMHTRLHAGPLGALARHPANREESRRSLAKAFQLLEFIGLEGFGDALATNLAYGMQRRLEIARALASDPILLLLDEPTAGMNPQETTEMIGFIKRLRDDLKLTIFLIEHDMHLVMNVSDNITVLDYGKVIADGTPEEIRANPRVIEAYLGSTLEEAQ
ncbi:MAG: ABC transporter ATP-binding protein [Anaerolineae bacterium]|nr:ABC transporter ATP-binding protein [Anaerolineae bacterium]